MQVMVEKMVNLVLCSDRGQILDQCVEIKVRQISILNEKPSRIDFFFFLNEK